MFMEMEGITDDEDGGVKIDIMDRDFVAGEMRKI